MLARKLVSQSGLELCKPCCHTCWKPASFPWPKQTRCKGYQEVSDIGFGLDVAGRLRVRPLPR
eukprot:14672643-Alexandrium_andersonii.AAC.1